MHVNFPSAPPARLLFHNIPVANDEPCTFADFLSFWSLVRRFAVATDPLLKRNPAGSTIHGHTECVTSIFTSRFSSIALRVVLTIPCTDWMALSTIPLLFELPTGPLSLIILDPLFITLSVLHDPIRLVEAGSPSDFTVMSTNSNPISRRHAMGRRQIHSPVDSLGTTVLSTALSLVLLPPKKNKVLSFLLVAHKHVVQMDLWDLSLFLD